MSPDAALGRIVAAACRGDAGAELRRVWRAGVPAGRVDEALLQLHLFAGYPAMINALAAWRRIAGPAARTPAARGDRRRLGERFCRGVYGAAYKPLMRNMEALHPVLPEWIVADGYGRVMARPGLSPAVRRRLAVAMLASLGAWRQLGPYLRATPGAGAFLRRLRGAVPAARLRRALRMGSE